MHCYCLHLIMVCTREKKQASFIESSNLCLKPKWHCIMRLTTEYIPIGLVGFDNWLRGCTFVFSVLGIYISFPVCISILIYLHLYKRNNSSMNVLLWVEHFNNTSVLVGQGRMIFLPFSKSHSFPLIYYMSTEIVSVKWFWVFMALEKEWGWWEHIDLKIPMIHA